MTLVYCVCVFDLYLCLAAESECSSALEEEEEEEMGGEDNRELAEVGT